nr:MAG TPA: hypothetical protein [Caudoviricetes sp.]
MAKVIKQCRICGKNYEYCHSCRKGDITFRWQEVACSPECGRMYFDQILRERGQLPPLSAQSTPPLSHITDTLIDDEDIIEEFEDIFDEED